VLNGKQNAADAVDGLRFAEISATEKDQARTGCLQLRKYPREVEIGSDDHTLLRSCNLEYCVIGSVVERQLVRMDSIMIERA